MDDVPRRPADPGAGQARIISLVPSWTETLIACGANVVGRSRFCIHPADQVRTIPKVGGTKDVKWEKVRALAPNLLILDKEENTREMAEASPAPVFASHIRTIEDCAPDLRRLAAAIEEAIEVAPNNGGPIATESRASGGTADSTRGDRAIAASRALVALASRWDRIAANEARRVGDWDDVPAVLDWIARPCAPPSASTAILYLIWKDPWMTVGIETFIGSVLSKLGLGGMHARGLEAVESHRVRPPMGTTIAGVERPSTAASRYPEVELDALDPEQTLLLCSSEPYPFARKRDKVANLGFPAAIVDGEAYSWFGLRSLQFLEQRLGIRR